MIYDVWYDLLMAEILTQIEPAQQSWATVAGTWHLVDENFQRFKTRKCVSKQWHFLEPAILNCWELCSYVLMLMHSVWAVRKIPKHRKNNQKQHCAFLSLQSLEMLAHSRTRFLHCCDATQSVLNPVAGTRSVLNLVDRGAKTILEEA